MLPRLLPVVGVMALAGLVASWILMRHGPDEPGEAPARIRNPFSLRAALSFAVVYAVVLLLIRGAREYFGTGGTYAAAMLSALADVDAVTIAFARLGPGSTLWRDAAAAVTVATVTNTLVKLGLGAAMGAGRFRRHVALGLGAMAVAGVVAGVVVYLQ
jgi:uncharacterized membrane protein (DUF4010 family)